MKPAGSCISLSVMSKECRAVSVQQKLLGRLALANLHEYFRRMIINFFLKNKLLIDGFQFSKRCDGRHVHLLMKKLIHRLFVDLLTPRVMPLEHGKDLVFALFIVRQAEKGRSVSPDRNMRMNAPASPEIAHASS